MFPASFKLWEESNAKFPIPQKIKILMATFINKSYNVIKKINKSHNEPAATPVFEIPSELKVR